MNGENPLPDPREKEIFCGALEIKDPQKRAEYLDAACGNNKQLRESVEKLLSAADHGGTLGSPFSKITSEKIQEIEEGTQTGKYSILNRVGGGGWGEVFRAKQKKILNRFVAIKFLNQGLDAESVLERFKREHEILADLNNPHIVTVLDQGVTSLKYGRRPYFVMKYVDGERITDYADNHRLNVDERLELFLQVCDAIQTAHTEKIIHRDIKPDNLLVTEINSRPFVMVIDFGIAKAVSKDIPFDLLTAPIGTPRYMSPEQTGQGSVLVDEKTDIYLLGLLLYELLAGQIPLDLKGDKAEREKKIRESIPLPPSARINEKDDPQIIQMARKRGVDPAQLQNMVRGELDRIVMKCLEKDPKNRYGNVEELGVNVKKHLVSQSSNGANNTVKPYNKKWGVAIIGAILVAGVLAWIGHQIGILAPETGNNATNSPLVKLQPESQIAPKPDYSTPDGLFREIRNAIDGNSVDISELPKHETVTGKEVWGWLIEKQWLRNKGNPRVIARDIECDGLPNKHTLDLIYDNKEGTEHLRVDFFIEGGMLKFHDIFLKKMKDDTYDMYLSDFIYNPHLAGIEFGLKNPGKVIGSFFGK